MHSRFTTPSADAAGPRASMSGASPPSAPAARRWSSRLVDWLRQPWGQPQHVKADAASASPAASQHESTGTTPGRRVLLPLAGRWGTAEIFSTLDADLPHVDRPSRLRSFAEAVQAALQRERQHNARAAASAGGPGDPLTSVLPSSVADALPDELQSASLPSVSSSAAPDDGPKVTTLEHEGRAEGVPANRLELWGDALRTAERGTMRLAAEDGQSPRHARPANSDFEPDMSGAPLTAGSLSPDGNPAVSPRRTVWLRPRSRDHSLEVDRRHAGADVHSAERTATSDHTVTAPPLPREERSALGDERSDDMHAELTEQLRALELRLDRMMSEGTIARVASG